MCLSNFKAIRQFKVPISWLRDFTRSYEKTSFRILRRGPGFFINVSAILWYGIVLRRICRTILDLFWACCRNGYNVGVGKYYYSDAAWSTWEIIALYILYWHRSDANTDPINHLIVTNWARILNDSVIGLVSFSTSHRPNDRLAPGDCAATANCDRHFRNAQMAILLVKAV